MPTEAQKEHLRLTRHPVGALLLRAADGEVIYPDEIADLRLPDRQRAALDQALVRVRAAATPRPARTVRNDVTGETYTDSSGPVDRTDTLNETLRYAGAIIDALPEDWEDRATYTRRRASMGDAAALADAKAADAGYSHLADLVLKGV